MYVKIIASRKRDVFWDTVQLSQQVSKKINTQRLEATVTKLWCIEQLNLFSVSGKICPRRSQADGHVWEDYSKGVVL